jgi:LPS-assembly protein
MAGAEGRYALDQGDKGALMANFLSDDLEAEGRSSYTDKERYWLRGKADQQLGDWTARVDLDLISDRDYLTEFDFGRTGLTANNRYFLEQFGRSVQDRTVDQRTNSLRTLRSWGNGMSLQASLTGIDDLAEGENGSAALWKLPEVKHNGRLKIYDEIKTDLLWDTDYVHYWREEGVGAQRIDLYPKVTAAVPFFEQRMETAFTAGLRNTAYAIDGNGDEKWADSDTENRILGSFESELSTLLRKDFGETGEGWSHALRPFLKHTYVTDDDKNLPQFDAVDSFGDQNKITYGANNFFTVSGIKRNKEEFERDYGYVKLQQSYDLRSDAGDEPFLPIELRTAWYPTNSMTFRYETDLSVYDDGFLRHFTEGDYRSGRGDIFSLDYLYYKNTSGGSDTSSVRFSALVNLMYDFSAGYTLEKSLEDSITVQEKVRLIYRPSCWAVELGAETTPDNEQITIMFQLANIGAPFGMDF